MRPSEGAVQLTVWQVQKGDSKGDHCGARYYCRVGTIEYLKTIGLQLAVENHGVQQLQQSELQAQLEKQIGEQIEDLTLEQVSPDGGRSTQLVHTFLIAKDSPFLRKPPYCCILQLPQQKEVQVHLQHCGTRLNMQPRKKLIEKMQDTMADVHDTLVGKRQVLPSHTDKRQLLGVADIDTTELLARLQRVTIVERYSGPSKVRVLVIRDAHPILAIDKKSSTEMLQLNQWQGDKSDQTKEVQASS